jgi:hypothetical protein
MECEAIREKPNAVRARKQAEPQQDWFELPPPDDTHNNGGQPNSRDDGTKNQ